MAVSVAPKEGGELTIEPMKRATTAHSSEFMAIFGTHLMSDECVLVSQRYTQAKYLVLHSPK